MVTEIRIKSYRLFFLSSKNLAALCHPSPEPLRIPINTSESTTGRQTRESIGSMQSKRGSACFLIREPPNA